MTYIPEVLPSTQSFINLAKDDSVYVDKTGIIQNLLRRNNPGPYFLARPRRFGKIVLIDTLENIFRGKREFFEGLEICKPEYKFQWIPYPVIRIDMNGVKSHPDLFDQSLTSMLEMCALYHKIDINLLDPSTALTTLIRKLSLKQAYFLSESSGTFCEPRENVVLLIDEYDFPLLPV
ncbi:MAG: AAA family ATPase [Deltaproteobacteria bacterium]|nr:AAA family ATPase [Deltaproteobacteria bacterium]